jgi:arylsulfatase A-like enzyme
MEEYNVVLTIIDSLRKDHVGIYGNEWIRTPNLDKFARKSTIFTQAFPESLPTIPVRRALWTGMRVFPMEKYNPRKGDEVMVPGWEPIEEDRVTLSEILNAKGYVTAFITDTYHMFKPSMNFHRGFDEWHWIRGQEIDHYSSKCVEINLKNYLTDKMLPTIEEKTRTMQEVLSSDGKRAGPILSKYLSNVKDRMWEEDYFPAKVFRKGARWLEENKNSKFFLLIDSFDPHEPWDPPHEFVDLYDPNYQGKEIIHPDYGKADYLDEKELKHMRAHYAGEVTLVDKWFGFFIQKMDELNLMEKTLFVVISDHGHQLGDHGYTGKVPFGLWPELMDLVLFIKHPENIDSGNIISEKIYNLDIFATILEVLGIKIGWKMDSNSLEPIIEGKEFGREYLVSRFSNYVWYRDSENVLICKCDGTEAQLYDVKKDPQQKKNIATEDQSKVKQLFGRILEESKGSLPLHPLGSRAGGAWYIY